MVLLQVQYYVWCGIKTYLKNTVYFKSGLKDFQKTYFKFLAAVNASFLFTEQYSSKEKSLVHFSLVKYQKFV